jgi:DNA invertase Pin-like site-specific DNA recombinase
LKRATSRANGTKFGRPRKVANAEHVSTANRMKTDGHTAEDVAKYLGVSRATLYRYLSRRGNRLAIAMIKLPPLINATGSGPTDVVCR